MKILGLTVTEFCFCLQGPVASPTSVEFKNVSSTGLTVSWQPPPVLDQNGPITSYKIRYYTTGSDRVKYITEMLNVNPSLSLNVSWRFNYSVVKLLESMEYSVAVAAENEQGEGPYSSEMVIRLPTTQSAAAVQSIEPTIVAVIIVVLILAIAGMAVLTSLYLCIKWKQLKARFEHHFQSKNSKGSHIYEEPKCSSAARGASIDNIYDVCGTPGRMSMQEEDCPERSDADEPTLNATNALFTEHTMMSDDVHSWASLHPQTPEFLDNPLYQPLTIDLTNAGQPTEVHQTAGRLVSSVGSHDATAKSQYSTISRRNSLQQSTMAFSEPVTMSHLERQEQQYDRLAPYRHQTYTGEPHSAPNAMSPGIFQSGSVHSAHHSDKVVYQNTSDLAQLQEGKDSGAVEELDYIHIYDAPRKGRDIYAVPRSCIATFDIDIGADSSAKFDAAHDPNSQQW